ncbi:unnamed protein product [Agarophyton chilense]|eukprot:gb/GEZJ01005078.1/.p1 GENE.gb/GEZJ01005078.1/~~gb/GEZJ01005078.1/.p1  ORF type:complete len:800 (-),score=91.97 gb/GEZJ01005078.1/:1079-3478(-)
MGASTPQRRCLTAVNEYSSAMLHCELPTDVVYVGREVCGELPMAEAREMLVTNGIGGYGSMTIAGSLSRSYHGLLIAALRPPLDRTLLLSKLCETVSYRGTDYYLSTDRRKKNALKRYTVMTRSRHEQSRISPNDGSVSRIGAGIERSSSVPPIWRNDGVSTTLSKLHEDEVVTPAGFELTDSFRLEGTVPVFSYSLGDAVLEKRIWMKHGQNTVYVTYYLRRATEAIELRMQALVNHRNHHDRTSGLSPSFNYSANVGRNGSTVSVLFTTREHHETTLTMMVSRGTADLTNEWMRGFVLSEERMRGLPHIDDNLHAATFIVELPPGGVATFVATAESNASQLSLDGETELAMQHAYERSLLQKFEDARHDAFQRRMEIEDRISGSESSPYSDSSRSGYGKRRRRRRSVEPNIKQLVLAADQFIISRGGGRSVVAGFHWFTDWARDTMISLPGLTIATGRYDVARSILQTFSKYVSLGMLPNRFPDDGSAPTETDYDNADGTLWYFEAIRAYYMASGDLELLLELFPILQDIVRHHCNGTRFGIIQDEDGLLRAGCAGLALTWMDAKTDIVYTQRDGKAVELAALWYNALNSMAFFASELEKEDDCDTFTGMADLTEQSFQEKFWNGERGYCYDVIEGGESGTKTDSSLRPNQLIAASLNWSPLTEEQRFMVLDACSKHLVTTHAVRTLSPQEQKYQGVYIGDIFARDNAYHQGIGWAWLLGPYVLSHLRVFGNRELARELLLPILRSHLSDAGVGQVSELFDGDAPHRARGCIAQAWSVAEILRAWMATETDDLLEDE